MTPLLRSISVLLSLAFAAPAFAEKRVALVIGNGAYQHAPVLANPKNDAEGVAAALKRLKFEVIAGIDLDEAATRRLLRDFAEKLEGLGKEDTAVLFYAGHGLQVSGKNYLVPVDAKLEKERDLDFQAVSFDFVQSLMEKTAQTNIVILDSCRDNPLARTLARGMGTRSTGIGRGLAEMRGINDTLIVYATSPGNVALDGAEAHSPFTGALLQHIERPGLEVRHMISEVRAAVIASTKGQQVPWEAASLTRQVYFAAAASPGATPAPPSTVDSENLFWQSIKDSKNAADYKDYLRRWPTGTFAEIAKRRIAEIEKAADTPPPRPDTPPPARPPLPSSALRVPNESIKFRRESEGGIPILVISGEILNQSNSSQTIAPMRLELLDKENRVLRTERIKIDNRMLAPGKRLPFQTNIPNSPPEAAAVRIVFESPSPGKPAAPTAPVPTRRVSTFEVGVNRDGINTDSWKEEISSANACQALCLSEPKCAAWVYSHETHRVYPRYCWMGTATGRPEQSSYHTSGVVRTTAQ